MQFPELGENQIHSRMEIFDVWGAHKMVVVTGAWCVLEWQCTVTLMCVVEVVIPYWFWKQMGWSMWFVTTDSSTICLQPHDQFRFHFFSCVGASEARTSFSDFRGGHLCLDKSSWSLVYDNPICGRHFVGADIRSSHVQFKEFRSIHRDFHYWCIVDWSYDRQFKDVAYSSFVDILSWEMSKIHNTCEIQ